jgi:para-nitrobenzyl esterase
MRSRRDFLKHSGLLIAASNVGFSRLFAAEGTSVVAKTAYGQVKGVEVGGIKVFKGVPYGASTAGRNRFMPPVAPASWTGVREAVAYGPSAPQREPNAARTTSALSVSGANLPPESEDCLVLNVWTPALSDGRKRPVMVWCHGGGFATGSGSSPVTEGANLARRGDE